MSTKKILFFLVLTVLFYGCSKDNPVTPPQNSSNTGKVLLKIDRENAPSNVAIVTATLSRENFSSITASLNLLSDTTADLTLQSIPIGIWTLKVEAFDTAGVVKYSGQTDVTILEGMITQVSLTLLPTSTGLGSIYIIVNWGNSSWTDHQGNPILSYLNNNYDYLGIAQPQVIYDGSKYRMYYVGVVASARKFVLYAESNDGISWFRPFNTPVLSPGNIGTWDELAVHPGAVIKDGSLYRMYYSGWSDAYGRWDIGLATSLDGITFTKHPTPVIYGTGVDWEYRIAPSSILKINGTFYLYYTGGLMTSTVRKIGLALSTDGITWTKYAGNPILTKTSSWEAEGPFYPSVIMDGNTFKMVYASPNSIGFGFATSPDGKNWTKSENNPFFTKTMTSNGWGSLDISYPNFVKFGNEYRIYYSGFNQTHSGKYKIGFMRKF